MKKYLIGILAIMFLACFALPALAKPVSIGIAPVKIELTLDKGENRESFINVTNTNDFLIDVKVEMEDFVATSSGEISFIPKTEEITSLRDWIQIDSELFTVEPNQKEQFTFRIKVPEDAEPGGHYAAIFFKVLPKTEEGFTATARIGSLILVDVPGKVIKSGEILGFECPKFFTKGPIKFTALFKNTGSVHYEPEGTIKVSSLLKENIAVLNFPKKIVFPHASRKIETDWNVKYLFGRYSAVLNLTDGEGKPHTSTLYFWVFPWKEILGILAVIALLFLGLRMLKKKFKIVVIKQEKQEKIENEIKTPVKKSLTKKPKRKIIIR